MKNEKQGGKEEARNRMAEISVFTTSRFWFPEGKTGEGAHNREKKEFARRQRNMGKDLSWESGFRVPTTNRLAHGGASMTVDLYRKHLPSANQSYLSTAHAWPKEDRAAPEASSNDR